MTETLFERYKEALRAGHVAVLRGRLEDAVVAYRDAISVAGDRAVPRASLGGVYLRLGDPEAALAAYEEALSLAPDDDPSIAGRAQALVVLRRIAEAAADYDRLAGLRSAADRPAEAAEAARRALAIEPTDARRSRHAALLEELRERAGPVPAPGPTAEAEEAPPEPDPELLVAAAEAAAARGNKAAAAEAALAAARAYQADSRLAAAFEACLQGIAAQPASTELHLLLADIAVDRGWRGHAGDTYWSLLRLAELDDDPVRADQVRAAAATHFAGDPRFTR